jgi:hypothetical protein
MRSVTIDLLTEGMKVAKPVLHDSGRVLLAPGVSVTRGLADRLRCLGVQQVWVEAEGPDEGALSEEAAKEMEQALERRFSSVGADPVMRQIREVIRRRIRASVAGRHVDDAERA